MSRTGGAGSGSLAKNDKGSINTNFNGYRIAAMVLFQPIGESAPGYQSPLPGNSATSFPSTELEINWIAKAESRKMVMNFF